mgnify:CR=1 FL=1
MKCPYCGSNLLYTVNTRPTKKDVKVWRRKKCTQCKMLFTTYESIDLSYLLVAKGSGSVVRFNRAKLFSSIYKAAIQGKHVDHGEMSILAEGFTQEVEAHILALRKKKITSSEIRSVVIEVLKKRNLNILFRYLSYFENISKRQVLKLLS